MKKHMMTRRQFMKGAAAMAVGAAAASVLGGCGKNDTPSTTAAASGGESGASGDKEFTLRCGITVSDTSVAAQALAVFKEEVEKATNQTVKVEVHYDGTMGNERDVIEGVSLGTIEMFCGSTAPLSNFTDSFQIWDLPFVVDINNMDAAYRIMDGEVGRDMLDSLSSIGIKGLAMAHNGFRFILNRVKEVKTPADASNMVIRTMENDIHLAFYQAIGANPTAMASTEAFTALAQGTIDGMDNNLDAFYTQGAFESAKYLTLTGHVFSASIFLMNQSVFDQMSKSQQDAVMAAIQKAAEYQRDGSTQGMEDIKKIAKDDYDVTVTEVPDLNAWKDCCENLYDQYKSGIKSEYWDAFF
ncbi:MAG: DctP family TRAP transporter solute-binding subunit [Lachnospiraceae bacterium]|nr:DctP family TRAP transporter solute-binding subunit [Lachnospiraceae bacterium]